MMIAMIRERDISPRDGEKKVQYALVRRGREGGGRGERGEGSDTQCTKLAIIV